MNEPVTDTIYFRVTVNAVKEPDHWVAKTLETAIFTYGATREDAEKSAGDANVLLVRDLKQQGMESLTSFMEKYGVVYSVGKKCAPNRGTMDRLERAA